MILRVLLLVVLLSHVFGDEALPLTYQVSEDGVTTYLTMDEKRFCVQGADGQVLVQARLVVEDGKTRCYHLGKPTGAEIRREDGGLVMVMADGAKQVLAACPMPPEPIGWQPYTLPAANGDATMRKQVAAEIRRRFDTEQRLRREALALAGGRLDAATLAKPEVAAAFAQVNSADADNWAWLERTLRRDGWIGRKSHGGPAHEALVLIALHNIQHLRMAATILAGLRDEWQRGEIQEMAVANVADRLALFLSEPLAYGIQGAMDRDGQAVIPVIADGALLDANRKRIGQPAMAVAVRQMGMRVLRIGDDGRLVGEGAEGGEAALTGLDALDPRQTRQDPARGLDAAGAADPELGAALAAAKQGDGALVRAWLAKAVPMHRQIVYDLLLRLPGAKAGADPEEAVVGLRPLYEAFVAGVPASDAMTRVDLENLLAYGLAARGVAPAAEELARAVALADGLEKNRKRPEIAQNPNGHGIVDTIACVRFRQGDLAAAARLWQQAITLAGKQVPELYRQRLAAAQAGKAGATLPR